MSFRQSPKAFISIFVCFACLSSTAELQPGHPYQQLWAEWSQTYIERNRIPGAAISITHKDNVIWTAGIGRRSAATREEVDVHSLFRLCSLAKPFTAIGINAIAEQGAVDLDQPVTEYVEELPWSDAESPNLQALLLHAGGVQAEAPFPYFTEIDFPNAEQLRASLGSLTTPRPPFSEYAYSNLGYALLGLVIENVSGSTWGEYVSAEIFNELGMEDAIIELDSENLPANFAEGFTIAAPMESRGLFSPYQTLSMSPAAGILASAADMSAFMRWHFRTLLGEDNSVLTQGTLKEVLKPHSTSSTNTTQRGLGYGFYDEADESFVGHGGYCPGYRSFMLLDLERELGVSVLINVNDASPYEFAYGLHGLVVAAANSEPVLASSSLDEYSGTYDRPGMPERLQVIPFNDQLLSIDLFSPRPADTLEFYRFESADKFQREANGDDVEFERDTTGCPARFWVYPTFHYLLNESCSMP